MIQFPEGVNAEIFLRDYWQKKPLLMRQGLPGFVSPLDGNELAGLALEEEVESRVVMEQGFQTPWELHHGPFDAGFFGELPESPWTLLVQGVDLWIPEVQAIFDSFPFLPRWRIDDIMVSYANDGGSVGPHFDYYDVFLIQGEGQRRWELGQLCDKDSPLLKGTALKLLEEFHETSSWVLEPGDVLYLPPCIAHHGVAIGECITYSLGFRSPTAGEMLDDLATEVISHGGGGYYRDPPLTPSMASDRIDPAFIDQARALLLQTLDDRELLGEWFASYMTRQKQATMDDIEEIARRARLPSRDGLSSKYFVNGVEVTPPKPGED